MSPKQKGELYETERPTNLVNRRARARPAALRVIGDDFARAVPLPASGLIDIGRAEDAAICIQDASVSRRHARLHLGEEALLEDLGSANGTWVGGRRLEPGERVAVGVGEPIDVGSVLLVLQGGEPEAGAPIAATPDRQRESAMERLSRIVDRVAPGTISVLLLGETGVGKEVLAETVHRRSRRAQRPLVRLNCAALSETLLESELFGHERGAFTGAAQQKPGLLETAEGGSVFLDEVGELPLPVQVKLLRVLEERMVLRVGGLRPIAIDVRFIAATNRDLEAEIEAGRFRQDLYFRLNGVSLYIPPLRERRDEILPLARRFAAHASAEVERPAPAFTRAAEAQLLCYGWPGNIRELRNVVERAALLSVDGTIDTEHLPLDVPRGARVVPGRSAAASSPTDEERRRILEVLEACGGNQTQAARQLGISRNTLMSRLAGYGVPRPRKR
jgi:two-component system, NtrC family, response regulator AtoC